MKEVGNQVDVAREIYEGMEKQKVFEAFIRHIYLEIRHGNLQKAIEIFLKLAESVHDSDQVAFVVQEMGEIFIKLGEADKAENIIKKFGETQEYSRFFYATWINFLRQC